MSLPASACLRRRSPANTGCVRQDGASPAAAGVSLNCVDQQAVGQTVSQSARGSVRVVL